MKPTNVLQYLQSVRKERKEIRFSNQEAVQCDNAQASDPPSYLTRLLKVQQDMQMHKTTKRNVCCTLLRLQNRKIRALAALKEATDAKRHLIDDDLILRQLPSSDTLPLGDSPNSIIVLEHLCRLAEQGAVSFINSDYVVEAHRRVDLKQFAAWLLAALSSIDPLCLQESEVASNISTLSRLMMADSQGKLNQNPLFEDENAMVSTSLLSPFEQEFVCCINYAMMGLTKIR